MIDPASAADWVQASLVAGLLASLAAGGVWALGLEQRQAPARTSRAPIPRSRRVWNGRPP